MLLDEVMPRYEVGSTHRIELPATPDVALAAVKRVTPGEMPLALALFAVRWLPSVLRGRGVLTAKSPLAPPVLDQMLASRFVLRGRWER